MQLPINNTSTAFYKLTVLDNYIHIKRDEITCPRCKQERIKQPNKGFVGKCGKCGNYHNFLVLLPHQKLIYELSNYALFNLGGVGSGKSTVNAKKVVDHMLNTPGGHYVCIEQQEAQLTKISRPEFMKQIHKD